MRADCASIARLARFALTSVTVLAALAVPLLSQGFPGTYSVKNQLGGITSLVLVDSGAGKLGGTFVGNGNSFQVTGVVADDEASGVIAGRGLSLFFSAHVKGETLLLVLAEPGANGGPNLSTAQQVVMIRSAPGTAGTQATASDGAIAGAAGAPAGGARYGTASTASGNRVAGLAAAATPQDKQLAQLFVANAWCAFSYSGSQTYSGTTGTTNTERVVMLPDGRVLSNQKSEFAGSVEAGSAVVSNGGNMAGYWRVERGVLAYSLDGVQWSAANFRMTYNSNGYPIPVVNGKEYMVCR